MSHEEYIERAAPRLQRMDAIAARCAFDKWPCERTPEEQRYWDEHQRLLAQQAADEQAAGL